MTIHPLYFCLLLYYVVIGKFWLFFSNLVAVLLHEIAHAYTARQYGYEMNRIVLMPYGAMIYGEDRFYGKSSVWIALSGPLASFLIALITLGVWWVVPDIYNYLRDFMVANLTLGVTNLLPCFPLDGARVVLGLTANKIKALKYLRVAGALLSVVMIALGIASFWYKPNVSLVNIGAFLLIGAFTGSKKEEYYFIASKLDFSKDYQRGVIGREVAISENVRIYMLLKYVSKRYNTVFVIVDSEGVEVGRIHESELERLLLDAPSATKVSDISF